MNASARKVSVQFLSWLSDEEMMEQWKKTHPLFTVCVAVLLYSLQPRVQEYGSSVCPFSSDIIDTEAHLNLHIHVQSAENKLNVAWCPQHKDCCVLCGPLRSKGGRGWADSPETLPLHSIPHTLFLYNIHACIQWGGWDLSLYWTHAYRKTTLMSETPPGGPLRWAAVSPVERFQQTAHNCKTTLFVLILRDYLRGATPVQQ